MDPLGGLHTGLAVAALALGAFVVVRRKGDRLHRTLGHLYASSMLGLNVTALLIYDLFDGFGPFHWAALASLVTVLGGFAPVVLRRPRDGWMGLHAYFMSWSYVGLLAAGVSEAATRLLVDVPFWLSVGVGTAAVVGGGAWLIATRVPGAIRRTRG